MKIWVGDGEFANIGDSITVVPFLNHWVKQYGTVEYGPGLNPWVSAALPKEFVYNQNLTKRECDYILICSDSWMHIHNHRLLHLHVMDGYAHANRLDIKLDYVCPFVIDNVTEDVDIVIAPFSAPRALTDGSGRVWQSDKWLELIHSLPGDYTVIGSASDDYSWLPVHVVAGRSLSYIAALIQKCRLFISIDSGPAQLANAIGKKEHVLLYPRSSDYMLTANLHAVDYMVAINDERPWVTGIPVELVVDTCNRCLKDFNKRV